MTAVSPRAPAAHAIRLAWLRDAARASAPANARDRAPATPSGAPQHVLADPTRSAELRRTALEITNAFDAIEPAIRELAPLQFESNFVDRANAIINSRLGFEVPKEDLRSDWLHPLDASSLYAHCVLATFCRVVEHAQIRNYDKTSEGEDALASIRRWGFHAIDVTPCADGRLSGVLDHILRVPPSVVVARTSHAGAMFDVEESLRRWEHVELERYRAARPNAASEPTRYLKIGVYHYSSLAPATQGCAWHGSDARRASAALLERLQQFEAAVRQTQCCDASAATLLIGVDTDTDAIRVHVPDASGATSLDRALDNAELYNATADLSRDAAKDAIRDAVAACANVSPDDAPTEGMRWFCGYLLKNNIAEIDAVRAAYGERYADAGHTERLIVVGDPIDDVQLRNLVFQAQMDTVEEGAGDLDIGVHVVRSVNEPRGLAVPILAHAAYDARIPGARERAETRALRLRSAILARYAELAAQRALHVHAVVRPQPASPAESESASGSETKTAPFTTLTPQHHARSESPA